MQSTFLPSLTYVACELVVDVGFRHKKIALPIDVSSWTFLPRTLDDIGGGNDDEGDLEAGINSL